jgi:hypothetical protein
VELLGDGGGGARRRSLGASGEEEKIRLDVQRELDKMQVEAGSTGHDVVYVAVVASALDIPIALTVSVSVVFLPTFTPLSHSCLWVHPSSRRLPLAARH